MGVRSFDDAYFWYYARNLDICRNGFIYVILGNQGWLTSVSIVQNWWQNITLTAVRSNLFLYNHDFFRWSLMPLLWSKDGKIPKASRQKAMQVIGYSLIDSIWLRHQIIGTSLTLSLLHSSVCVEKNPTCSFLVFWLATRFLTAWPWRKI